MTFAILPIPHSYTRRSGNQCEWCLETKMQHRGYPKRPYCTSPPIDAVDRYLMEVERKKEEAHKEQAA